ncbi:Holliday junction resolvase RuvX [Actinomyces sp. oral taxon 181]|uniref:Holliday junction resolvase RuvX n=1 Tax=Actinomyces sp. oral taxon 181 TaxID=712121 RepID=UPI0025C17415|nr:Holliday junction resolvase RuvX [Actinomyces sp. oral taxon 181]MBS5750914.1 Holliday junction resolvase RuvX [Actinomyces sp. oral taxon 181]
MRPGVRLAVDVGTVRVGLARSDAGGILALPLETLTRQDDASEINEIVRYVHELEVIEIIVGLPRHMRGGEGISAKGARRYARKLKMALPECRVCLVDERLSSYEGHERLLQAGVERREHRQMIDQVAASIILETALEMERMNGRAPGKELVLEEGQ